MREQLWHNHHLRMRMSDDVNDVSLKPSFSLSTLIWWGFVSKCLHAGQCFQMYVFTMNTMSVFDRFSIVWSVGENASKTRYAFSTENALVWTGPKTRSVSFEYSTVYRQNNSKMLVKCKDLRTRTTNDNPRLLQKENLKKLQKGELVSHKCCLRRILQP